MPNVQGRDALEARARKIVEALGGSWSRLKGMCCCPAHVDRTPSLSITLGSRAILVHCFAGCSNEAVMLGMARLGVRISDLFDGACGVVTSEPREEFADRNALRLWREASILSGSPAERYLAWRGITASFSDMRFHPRMPLGPKSAVRFLPALVAAVRNDAGILALHRTFLDPGRDRLARFDQPKRALGRLGSGAVRLAFPRGGRLGLAEGSESALSAMQLFGIPCWATLGNERFGLVTIPESVRELHLFVDNDAGGRLAEERALEAHSRDGRRIISRPPTRPGDDWNDELKPTLDSYASHDLVEGLVRLPAEPAPLTEAELVRLDELDASYDENAAVLEDEDSAEDAIAAAEAAIEAIERECQEIRARPPVLAPEIKAEAGMILVLSRDGTPVLQPVFYGQRQVDAASDDDAIEVVAGEGGEGQRRSALSKRLVDELAMQRRDVLALHVASDPSLALDFMVFTLADADTLDYRARAATTLRGGVPAGPITGFEAKDAAASASLAEFKSGLDEHWRAGGSVSERFEQFRALPDETRAAWLGHVVGRTLEASLNMAGERRIEFHDHLGSLIGIDMAAWWRPTAANYFDRVSKAVILDALSAVGGPDLSSRFASVKKGDLAMSAERVFAGTYITEVEVRDRALAWVPEVMRFAGAGPAQAEQEEPQPAENTVAAPGGENDDNQPPRELAA